VFRLESAAHDDAQDLTPQLSRPDPDPDPGPSTTRKTWPRNFQDLTPACWSRPVQCAADHRPAGRGRRCGRSRGARA